MPESEYDLIRTHDNELGVGGIAVVHKIMRISDGEFVAVKSAFGNNIELL